MVITSDPLEYRVPLAQNWRIPLAQHTPIKRTVGMIYKLSDNIDNIDTAPSTGWTIRKPLPGSTFITPLVPGWSVEVERTHIESLADRSDWAWLGGDWRRTDTGKTHP